MNKLAIYIIGVFFIIGAVDYLLGSPLKIGNKFEDGMKTMGALALGILGIYSLTPLLLKLLSPAAIVIGGIFHIDPSMIPASMFATDMGGYQLSKSLALTGDISKFTSIIVAATLGTVISFTIPVACGLVNEEDREYLGKGMMIGIVTIPFGCLAAGLFQGLSFFILIKNLFPIFIISALLSLGLVKAQHKIIKGFSYFGKFILLLSVLGILLQGINIIFGYKVIDNLIPFEEAMTLVGKITFVLAGAYPMLEVLNRTMKGFFSRIGKVLGINSISVAGMVGNLASNLIVFGNLNEMNQKGKIMCTALGVSGAFVFGGQLAFVASVEPDMIGAYFVAKFVSSALSIILVCKIYNNVK